MYTLISLSPLWRLVYEPMSALATAWHSFSLEAVAFLATRFAIDAVIAQKAVRPLLASRTARYGS